MDLDMLKGYRKTTKVEEIHNELFKETVEYKYYLLGMAQGLSMVYEMFSKFENKNYNYTNGELMQVIEYCANDNEKIRDYFNRLIKKETK